jgi:indolepyruvate ferredoxin oxidoreductase beta subunit
VRPSGAGAVPTGQGAVAESEAKEDQVEVNIILAGVGGQGILTIARAVSVAGLRLGLQIKQAEVHGMSQRGGAVQSHLRVADHDLASDLIPLGAANMVLSVEPLEALRYVQYLRKDGVIVASSNAFVNIPDYPPLEGVLERIARFPRHVLLDADQLSRMVGSARSANIVLLGAASLFLEIEAAELEDAVGAMFGAKGPKVVEMNRLAFRLGRNAGQAYRDRLKGGDSPAEVRKWMNALTLEELSAPGPLAPSGPAERPTSVG